MSRTHPEQWTVRTDAPRADPDVVAALAALPTTQIADSGGPVGVLAPGIGPVAGPVDFCGSAVTVWTKPGDILFLLKAPDLVGPGDVLVVDGGGRLDAAVVGDFVARLLRARGATGLVVDGAVRDVDGIRDSGLPVLARGAHPATGSKDGPGALGVAVSCGGVVVRPGDVVRADASGAVVVPRDAAAEVLALTREVAAREAGWEREIAAGATFTTIFDLDAVIRRRGA